MLYRGSQIIILMQNQVINYIGFEFFTERYSRRAPCVPEIWNCYGYLTNPRGSNRYF